MRTRLLDADEFQATVAAPMRDVLACATNVIDIWPYVSNIPIDQLFGNRIVEGCVEAAYRNAHGSFDHVLVVTQDPNVFVVVVIDLKGDTIFGHHLLDLNHEYGLGTTH